MADPVLGIFSEISANLLRAPLLFYDELFNDLPKRLRLPMGPGRSGVAGMFLATVEAVVGVVHTIAPNLFGDGSGVCERWWLENTCYAA